MLKLNMPKKINNKTSKRKRLNKSRKNPAGSGLLFWLIMGAIILMSGRASSRECAVWRNINVRGLLAGAGCRPFRHRLPAGWAL